jgi:hypothetical protein
MHFLFVGSAHRAHAQLFIKFLSAFYPYSFIINSANNTFATQAVASLPLSSREYERRMLPKANAAKDAQGAAAPRPCSEEGGHRQKPRAPSL